MEANYQSPIYAMTGYRTSNTWSNRLDRGIAILGLIYSTDGLESFLTAFGLPLILLTLIRYLIPAIILLRLAARPQAVLKTLQSDLFLIGFNIILFTSVLWSVNQEMSLESIRSLYLPGVLIALFLATRFSLAQQVRLIALSISCVALMSLVVVFVDPNIGIHQNDVHAGSWRGILYHKNYFSSIMNLGAASLFVLLLDRNQRSIQYLLFLGLILFLILMSTSKTGQVILITVVASIMIYQRFRWRGMRSVLVIYLAVFTTSALLYTLVVNWEAFFTAIGRDGTLTGRTPIWQRLVEEYIPNRFFLGYGVQSFWPSAIFRGLSFVPAHSHNGWLDMLIDVGFVGFFLYLASNFQAWVRILNLAYASNRSSDLWPLALFTALTINNITESLLLYKCNIFWVLYMAACWTLKEELMLKPSPSIRVLQQQSAEIIPQGMP